MMVNVCNKTRAVILPPLEGMVETVEISGTEPMIRFNAAGELCSLLTPTMDTYTE